MKFQVANCLSLVSVVLMLSASPLLCQAADTLSDEELAALIKDLKNMDPKVRARGASELGKLGERAVPAARQLCTALYDSSASVRLKATQALEHVYPKLYLHIITLTRDRKGSNHFIALIAIQKMESEANAAVPVVSRHLTYNLSVMQMMRPRQLSDLRKALALQDTEELIFSLVQYETLTDMFHTYALLAYADVQALSHIASNERAVADFIATHTLRHPAELVRLSGVQALGRFGAGAEKHLPILKKLKLDPLKEIRDGATKSIKLIESP